MVELPVYPSHSPSNLHYQLVTRTVRRRDPAAGGSDQATKRGGQGGSRDDDAASGTVESERVYWIRSGASTRKMTSPQEMVEWGFDRGRAAAAAQIVGRAAEEGKGQVVDLVLRMQQARQLGGKPLMGSSAVASSDVAGVDDTGHAEEGRDRGGAADAGAGPRSTAASQDAADGGADG